MATITANNIYKYDTIYFNKSLDEWIQEVHINNLKYYGWKNIPLKRGCFGYDNIAISLNLLFDQILNDKTILDNKLLCAHYIHLGWTMNYIYWRDYKPWLTNNNYIKPSKSLNDSRRNNCAKLSFNDLDDEEKEKDLIIVEYLINNIKLD